MKSESDNKNSIDNEKYFDETQYRTAIVKTGEEFSTGNAEEDKLNNLIALLTDPVNKDFKEETLLTLKKENAGSLLIEAIKKSKNTEHLHILIAACWESEINFSEYFSFFIELVTNDNYLASIEAITVIENMEGTFDTNDIKNSIKKLKEHKNSIESEQQVLINDFILFLQEKI